MTHTQTEVPLGTAQFNARHWWTIGALVLLTIPCLCALSGLAVSPDTAFAVNPEGAFMPPSPDHPMGTDEVGRDVRARLLRGAANSLLMAGAASLVALVPAIGLGALAALLARIAGWLAELALLPAEILRILPMLGGAFLLELLLSPAGGLSSRGTTSGSGTWLITLAALILFPRAARVAFNLWRTSPISPPRISLTFFRLGTVFFAMIFFALGVLGTLDLLGFGVQPPTPTLGSMLTRVQDYMFLAPILAIWPGLVWLGLAFVFFLASDALIRLVSTRDVMVHMNS